VKHVKTDLKTRRRVHETIGIKSEKLLLHKDFIEKRRLQLEQIALLCKLYHKKVKISFKTSSGEQFIETSLWMSTGQYVILNDGRFIPVNAIIDISF
jgi:hypothetical protein